MLSRLNCLTLLAVLLTTASLPACGRSDTDSKVADPVPSAAESGRPMTAEVNSFDWLVNNSPFVFVGRLSAKSVETDSRGLVVTRNRFDVENTLVGASPQKVVTLTTLGGTIGDETFSVSHMPEFVEGQTYVIFTDLARTTYNPITGDDRGVFLVANSEVYTYGGRAIAGVQDGKIRLSSVMLDRYPGANPREPGPSDVGNPTVGGAVISAERVVVTAARPIQLAEFSDLVLAARR
jgi:hypothetical protein